MDSSSSINPSTTTTTTSSSSSSSSSGSELFICFNTRRRLTTRISARPSILSPARDPQISLSTCRSSRRLRTSGSTARNRGRSSPMFAGAAKKRASGFDNPEPSSPKVTCIGQVRVKPKKKGIKLRTSRRRQSGEVSFRTLDQIQRQSSYNNTQFQHSRNQRWVHLPSSICESFNCLIPCTSPCVCENDKGYKKEVINEVKVAQENFKNEEEPEMLPMRSARRHIFDGIQINKEGFQVKDDEEEKNVSVPPKNALLLMRSRSDPVKMDEEKNVNVPPRNALLLMRCRSDPVKMEALVNRCWEPQLPKQVEEDDDDEQAEEEVVEDGDIDVHVDVEMVDTKDFKVSEKGNQQEETGVEKRLVVEDEDDKENNLVNVLGVDVDEESEEDDDEIEAMEHKNEDESRVSYSNASFSLQTDDDDISEADDDHELPTLESDTVDIYAEKMSHIKITREEKLQVNNVEETEELETEYHATAIVKRGTEVMKPERKSSKLPDCLLLMMCEPKLSMEVSKETWVSKREFVQEQVKVSVECNAALPCVAKSSCTFPASMAAMIEQKLMNAAAYEPFVLTRCKSAPIRTAGAIQLAPDGWFWKNEGLEKHRRGGFRIGAAELVAFQLSR
ncbi:hypothetical protein POM88_006857 [Heracleum sosnowskyi]|uniref:Uncharacterized protein n=1 Tax=Heracleum sosnowskyi TaxID=360622 RepID=A0AAD8N548_9APIA|nr:hypothetical protein POM88_006857 [Heracleum sosnowskyi]